MNLALLITLGLILVFCLGGLAGTRWSETISDERSRRQAARERNLTDQGRSLREQWHLLHEREEAFEEELRWASKRQAGLVVLDHDTTERAKPTYQESPRRSA